MAKPFNRAFLLIAMTLAGTMFAAAQTPKIKLGFAKCAHCLPMSLTPGLAKGVEIEATGFNSGNDVLTALVSKSIDVAQVTYLHYVTALDKGFDVVAVSGQIKAVRSASRPTSSRWRARIGSPSKASSQKQSPTVSP